jgi:Coenzyme PQQ synthesis protein D (PqqD)
VGDATSAPLLLNPESRLVLSRDQVSCDLAGEAAIVNLKNGVYYGLDAVGARVWNLMREPVTFAGIIDSLLQIYEVERATLEADVRRFLNELAQQGLVEISA